MGKSITEEEKIKIEPDFNKALCLRDEEKYDDAIKILEKLNSDFPDNHAILLMLAGMYHLVDDWENCFIYSQKLVEISPNSERASVMLFHSLWGLKKFDDAFEEARRFVDLNGFSKEYDLILKEIDESKNSVKN
ncbi:MAG: tetratricopeptide repeat protein [Acidobacteriota bacterium]|nr:tetratricopeptide repeat protein [Acidobacteriota bacterium]